MMKGEGATKTRGRPKRTWLNKTHVACLSSWNESNQKEKGEGTSLVQQSRRPNLSSLQIPVRSLENTSSAFARIEISSAPSPTSTKAGLPPRPPSAKFKSSMRNLLPQRSLRAKNLSEDGEKTVLIIPDTPSSDGPLDKPTTSRSFSLNKVLFPSVKQHILYQLHQLQVQVLSPCRKRIWMVNLIFLWSFMWIHTPNALHFPFWVFFNVEFVFLQKVEVQHHMTRSLSVPVNVKARSLRRMDSTGGLIRVISATPRPVAVDGASQDDAPGNRNWRSPSGSYHLGVRGSLTCWIPKTPLYWSLMLEEYAIIRNFSKMARGRGYAC
ncbi:hypothetical protein CK203_041671 [Vitis vinifera]|uniref:Uncharacterized protein n=1 Tax=Vitis vinifera TaxID=29760 RepID=A0A438HCV4_VITVI|nr:hypothetical protein CK203_041671 [Vitis vinifera]